MVVGLGASTKGRWGSVYAPGVVSGTLSRPASVGDLNDIDDDAFGFAQMTDEAVHAEFEKMLENMNLSEVRRLSFTGNNASGYVEITQCNSCVPFLYTP